MNDYEKQEILSTLKESIFSDPKLKIGPVFEKSMDDGGGIWVMIAKHEAYLGACHESAMLTAKLSDWWIQGRDGELTTDDRKWFERRAKLGDQWEQQEIPIYREERRLRLAQNIGLATNGEPEGE